MGGPVRAIRLINQKQLLLVMVGINMILSVGNEYVKLSWKFTGNHGGRIGISDIWRNLKWLKKQENCVHIEVLCIPESWFWKVRAGVSGCLTFENIWHDWNYKNANNFLGFKLPKQYAYWIPQYFRSCCWKNDMLSFQIEASHLHIPPEWLCQPEIGYTTLHFFSNQHTHYLIDFALFINNGGRTWKKNWSVSAVSAD